MGGGGTTESHGGLTDVCGDHWIRRRRRLLFVWAKSLVASKYQPAQWHSEGTALHEPNKYPLLKVLIKPQAETESLDQATSINGKGCKTPKIQLSSLSEFHIALLRGQS
jgi:hypothetical protein